MIRRTKTGIPGLDEITDGGFIRGTVNLVSGPAGSGKSLLGLQYLYGGAKDEKENGLGLTLEESRTNLERATTQFFPQWGKLEEEKRLGLVDLGELRRGSLEERRGLGFREVEDFLGAYLEQNDCRRLVIDSLVAIGLHYRSMEELREEMFYFARFLREHDVTSLLITESLEDGELTRFGVEQFVCDSFLLLGLDEMRGTFRRTFTIRKMRFTNHSPSKHPVLITKEGLEIASEEKVMP